MKLKGIRATDANSYVVTFAAGDGTEREFDFAVDDDLGVPAVQWGADFERALGMRLSSARPVVSALQAVHSSRGATLDMN
jgi:hypothetical protein